MPTLVIKTITDAGPVLADLVRQLQLTSDAASDTGDAMPNEETAALRDEVRQLTAELARLQTETRGETAAVIEHRASWSQLASVAVPAIGTVTTAGVQYATVLAKITWQKELLTKATNVWATATGAATTQLARGQQAANLALRSGERLLFSGAARLAGYGAAAATATTILAGATIGLKGYEFVLARTGVTVDRVTGETVTNYDRMAKAVGDFATDAGAWYKEYLGLVAENAKEAGRYIAENSILLQGARIAWEEVDRAATATTIQGVQNLRDLGSAIRGVSREAIEASEQLAAAQAASVDDFARVRGAEQSIAAATAARARAAQIAGMATTQAIDDEINKLKERRGIAAANNQFDEEAQAQYLTDIERLEQRRNQIETAAANRRRENQRKEAEEARAMREDAVRRSNEITDERNRREEAAWKEREQLAEQEAKRERELAAERYRLAGEVAEAQARQAEKAANDYADKWQAAVARVAQVVRGQGEQGGPDAIAQIRGRISPRDIARQVAEQRGQTAARDWKQSDEAQRMRQALIEQGVAWTDADRRVSARARRVGQDAYNRGFGDTLRGRASEQETAAAQNQLIQANVNQAIATGQLTPVVAQGLQQAAQQAMQATNEALAAKQTAEAVLKALEANGQRLQSANRSTRR